MKVAMVRVPTIIDVSAVTAPICPPIGLAYLATVVAKLSCELIVVDSVGEHPEIRTFDKGDGSGTFKLLGLTTEEILERVPTNSDVILVSIMFSQDFLYARNLVTALRASNPKATIVAGGEHITALPEHSMEACPAIDLCVIGEGESTLYDLLSRYRETGSMPLDGNGTCVRIEEGGYRMNHNSNRIRELGTIDRPDWSFFPLENYLAGGHGFGVNRGRSMPIIATRGCPYQCTFCSSPQMWTTLWRSRDPADVIAEIKDHIRDYNATNFDFYDLTRHCEQAVDHRIL